MITDVDQCLITGDKITNDRNQILINDGMGQEGARWNGTGLDGID